MAKERCVCGCGGRAVQKHHIVYVQELRRQWSVQHHGAVENERRLLGRWPQLKALLGDERNLVEIAHGCHGAHHARSRPLSLHLLPDAVFEFAAELMGREGAFEYLRRRYAGGDPRLDALVS